MRTHYDEELAFIKSELVKMGALCETAIANATKALEGSDEDFLTNVQALEEETDRIEHNLESLCLKLFLKQQPVASDFLRVSAALKMITDMERIGDQALNIAEIIATLKPIPQTEYAPICAMAETTVKMLNESIQAFASGRRELAQNAIKLDATVDENYHALKHKIIAMIAENKDAGEVALELFMVAKYLERIGDHAVNVAEWAIYSISGEREY